MFSDVTDAVGIDDYQRIAGNENDFVVRGGTPIVMDFDRNGWLDIYIVRYQLDDILYQNNGGAFTKVVNPLGLDTANAGNVAAWADIDNDGDSDMIVGSAYHSRHFLYLNNGDGSFREVAENQGLDHTTTTLNHQATAVTVGDINRDGYLDVIIGSWGVNHSEGSETEHHALFLNKGETNPGHFTNITESSDYLFPGAGIAIFAPSITDLDQDGWPDIATTSDYSTSALHWNNADGTFTNATNSSGVGLEHHGMGTAIGDVDNDGDLDWFVTTIAFANTDGLQDILTTDDNPLYINQGNRLFKNESIQAGVNRSGWGWGTNFFDYDHDGDLDIVLVNQQDIDEIHVSHEGSMYLFRNDSDLVFTDVSHTENANQRSIGSGLVTFDFNNDGALDIFYVNEHSRPTLLQNESPAPNSWLKIGLEGRISNTDGIGAFVTLQPTENGPSYVREFNPTNAYLAQLSPYLHFGFPAVDAPLHSLSIRWPSGVVQELSRVSADQLLTIIEDESLLAGDTLPAFTQQPENLVINRGDVLNLSVSFDGEIRPRVTWYRNGQLLSGVEGRSITIENMQPRDAGTYYSIATNNAGSTKSAEFVVGVRSDFSDRNIARQWNELILDSARINFPDPPIVARTFYHCSAAMWDAYWAYQPEGWTNASPVFHREDLNSSHWQGNREAAQAEALSHAVYTVARERYRKAFNHEAILLALEDFMSQQGYDPKYASIDGYSPASVGNRIGQTILTVSLEDGSNEANGYADTTGYTPINEPLVYGTSGVSLNDPNRWQPLNLPQSITKNGIDLGPEVQTFLAPGWNWVNPFALEKPTESTILIDPGPQPRFGEESHDQLVAEIVEVIRASSILDPGQKIIIDVSPGAPGQNNPYLTQDGLGHALNPVTGQPYEPNPVNQGDYYRLTAEFWSDGPGIEGPPGVWNMLHNQTTDDPRFVRRLGGVGQELSPLEWDIHAYLALNGALHDAAIAAWTIKSKYDSIRPISLVRYLASLGQSSNPNAESYHPLGLPLVNGLIELITSESSAIGQRHAHLNSYVGELALFSWRGVPNNPRESASGVGWVRAADWGPYHLRTFPTPNFAGYISGHSTFSRAGAEVMTLLTGSPFFPGGLKEFKFEKGKYLQVEYGPSEDLSIQVATYYDAADLTGVARIYCGVHIAADDFMGRKVGARVGVDSVLKVFDLAGYNDTTRLDNLIVSSPPDANQNLLVRYMDQTPLEVRFTDDPSDTRNLAPQSIYFSYDDNAARLQFSTDTLSRVEVLKVNATEGLRIIDFNIEGTGPAVLLINSSGNHMADLRLYYWDWSNFNWKPVDSNQIWTEHSRGSIASTLMNRRDLAGNELGNGAAALNVTLSPGVYRLVYHNEASPPEHSTLSLELIK
ncbi:FG-GAP-like repeat-containing protein [Pelagicoccus sp. SDUM812003]|uniref:FG-GAP-like repeat-containing protein n=1 Tax=Pelagicoccus sp. SDUM812003 TaxID=3041267 RepID=UPI0028101371|nr:FG-GAP-like repeat-containing protein [Pelagicoccus sp. SDUM812003]MDQ8201433.1 FG-GAP-like repeat-containing protein [Pelagicoccus sp. SDUM812003]